MRVLVIALVFCAAAIFGFINHVRMANQLNQPPQPAPQTAARAESSASTLAEAGTPAVVASPDVNATLQPAEQVEPALTLADQLELQTRWLQSLAKEYPDSENEFGPGGLPYAVMRSTPLDEHGVLLVEQVDEGDSVARRWNPFTGELRAVLRLQGFDFTGGLVSESGLYFLVREQNDVYMNVDHLVFVEASGAASSAPLWSVRDNPDLVLLSDESVLILGGWDTVARQHVKTVEMATFSRGRMDIEALRDYPGPPRSGYSIVTLANGRMAMLGGSISSYGGCRHNECTDSVLVLDPRTRLWTTGPSMRRARAGAAASLLADGSILVSGGWRDDGKGGTRRSSDSERILLDEYRAERATELPVPMADHRAVQIVGHALPQLLLVDSHSSSLWTYDVATTAFRVVGGYSSLMSFERGPYSNGSEHFFWVSADDRNAWLRQDIHLGDHRIDHESLASRTVHLFRTASRFLPASSGRSALVVGGYVRHSDESTTAVDAYSIGTGLRALMPLPDVRIGAGVFRLRNGAVIVAGGSADYPEYDPEDGTARALPLQVLSAQSNGKGWHSVPVDHPHDTQYAQWLVDGLVAIVDGRSVEHLNFEFDVNGVPETRSEPLPDLPAFRGSRREPGSTVVAKGSSDGRLIVAGGIVHEKRIAVMQESPTDSQRFIGRGELVAADNYEIYEPVWRRWTTSASSSKRGGQVQIMDDGRVARLHRHTPRVPGQPGSMLIEISHADGGSWTALDADSLPRISADSARLVTMDNELFVSGISSEAGDGPARRTLQWFDFESNEWISVWHEEHPELDAWQQDVLAIVDVGDKQHLVVPVRGH